jgi:dipeptidyl aminopeptidase/acylaminoacyl peptidase
MFSLPAAATRAPRPDDLYRLLIPTDPRLAPDGSAVTFTLQRVGPAFDRYATAIWIASTAGDPSPRQLTIGARQDGHARWSPDGATIAFLSDRRTAVEEEPAAPKDREDARQIHLLPAAGPGEARRLTDLPRGVDEFSWSPDGRRIAVLSASRAADREADARARRRLGEAKPGEPPASDYRYFDRAAYQENGLGFSWTRKRQLWVVDAKSGEARRLTNLAAGVDTIDWSPDGRSIAFSTARRRSADIESRSRILAIEVDSGKTVTVAERSDGFYFRPAWLPDGRSIAAFGGRLPHVFYRIDIHVFAADGSAPDAGRDLTSRHYVMASASMNSDLTIGEGARLVPAADGRGILFLAPHRGAMELWRIALADGALERLTDGQHYLSSFDAIGVGKGTTRVATIRSTPVELPDVHVADVGASGRAPASKPVTVRAHELRRLTDLNGAVAGELELREPIERWVPVEGREIQAWLIPGGKGARPGILEIHGGPHTMYGGSPFLEFLMLAGAGISVLNTNPRGSEGYGLAFNEANLADWGEGPTRDVLACVDAFVAEGLLDPDRLGVTGGSYGGYLTSWIVGHDDRFKAAIACRSVNDLQMLFLTGDIGGSDWPQYEMGAYPLDNPGLFRAMSPITYAQHIRTPLLIQHSDNDIRTTVGQAEALFSVLRRLRRPVRLMRVPDETHELTRSGTPWRRVENLVQVRAWFEHFLVAGKRNLPPIPKTRHGI